MPTASRIGLSFDQFSFVRMCRSIAGLCRIGVLTLTIQARFYTNQWLVAKRQQALGPVQKQLPILDAECIPPVCVARRLRSSLCVLLAPCQTGASTPKTRSYFCADP